MRVLGKLDEGMVRMMRRDVSSYMRGKGAGGGVDTPAIIPPRRRGSRHTKKCARMCVDVEETVTVREMLHCSVEQESIMVRVKRWEAYRGIRAATERCEQDRRGRRRGASRESDCDTECAVSRQSKPKLSI